MITIRTFTAADIPLGMRLKDQAGWNQLEADWRRAVELDPNGCFVGSVDGVDASTLTTCLFGDTAWIAMVLTDPQFRGRGLATALLRHAIDYLGRRGARRIRLDATALGRPVYEKLGFRVDGEAARYVGRPRADRVAPANPRVQIVAFDETRLAQATAFDAQVSGNDRTSLLRLLLRDESGLCRAAVDDGGLAGFVMARRGSRAVQIGPCLAEHEAAGLALLDGALAALGDAPAYIDVPAENRAAADYLTSRGLTIERNFLRMTLGDAAFDDGRRTFANFGPEKG